MIRSKYNRSHIYSGLSILVDGRTGQPTGDVMATRADIGQRVHLKVSSLTGDTAADRALLRLLAGGVFDPAAEIQPDDRTDEEIIEEEIGRVIDEADGQFDLFSGGGE